MYGLLTHLDSNSAISGLGTAGEEFRWFAIHTISRHEKRVVQQLQENGIFTFLPLTQEIRQWSDRRTKAEVPLFSCYAFVQMLQRAEERLRVLRTPGVLGFVGSQRMGAPIPNEEIESLQMAIREKTSFGVHPFLTAGKRVRVRGGALDGLEGILIRHGTDQSLVLSVKLLRRSISIRVEGYDIEQV